MKYYVEYSKKSLRQLRKLDKPVRTRIYNWLMDRLDGCENPRRYGKSLTGSLSEYWSYRVGDYRVIADIQDDKVIIFITEVAHRREVYDL